MDATVVNPRARAKRLVVVTFKIDERLLRRLDELVTRKIFTSRSEAIREAVRLLLKVYGGEER